MLAGFVRQASGLDIPAPREAMASMIRPDRAILKRQEEEWKPGMDTYQVYG